ncbi:MAG: sialate O-acetylesterase, partial [Candidatus Scatosoma sp.]
RICWLNDDSAPHFEKATGGAGEKEVLRLTLPAEMCVSVAEEPVGEAGKTGKLALWFAKKYVADGRLKEGRKALIVNAAVGGTGFCRKEWGVGNVLYNRLTEMTDYALSLPCGDAQEQGENAIAAFLWHQGECDSFENADLPAETKYETHKANLEAMFGDFALRFADRIAGNKKLPIIAGGFCDEWYLKNKRQCDAVLRAIKEVCRAPRDGNFAGAFVPTDGLLSNNQKTGNGDEIHFCRESLHILGERYYRAFAALKQSL